VARIMDKETRFAFLIHDVSRLRRVMFDRIVRNVGEFTALQREIGALTPRVSLWLTGLKETVDQLPDFGPASFGWHSGSSYRLLARPEDSGEQTQDRGRHGGHLCGTATGLDREPFDRRQARDEYGKNHGGGRSRSCALGIHISQHKLFARTRQARRPFRKLLCAL